MQIGITIPLQKHMHLKSLPYGDPVDLLYCWETHVIDFRGRKTMVSVNANNRYLVMLRGMTMMDWMMLPERLEAAIEASLRGDGYTDEQIDRYFDLAGATELTKTHGRKPVAGLNRAIELLFHCPEPVDDDRMFQKILGACANRDIYRPAGYDRYDQPVKFFYEDMKRVGIFG